MWGSGEIGIMTPSRIYQFTSAAVLFLSIICLPGCLKKKKPQPCQLKPLRSYLNYEKTQNDVALRAKKLTKRETIKTFGPRGKQLFNKQRKTIQPIQLSIENNSTELLVLKPEHIDLQLTPYNHVASRLKKNTLFQMLGTLTVGALATAAIATGGVAALVIGGVAASVPLIIAGTVTCIASPFFLLIGAPIATTVKGIETAKANNHAKKQVREKTLPPVLLIEPGQTIDTLIFVKKRNYSPQFDVTFMNQHEPEQLNTFTVILAE